jgi:putative tryptophan/tyrosine transport system substrate-binding protein
LDRRRAITALAVIAFATESHPVRSQKGRIWRVGYLSARSMSEVPELDAAFVDGMRELGYVEGANLILERRYADDDYARLETMAKELVRQNVDVIVASPSPAIRAAKKATTSIPIVFPITGDPVGSGFVASLARPGGNITGLSNSNLDVSPKLAQLLKEINPNVRRVALLGNPGSSTYGAMRRNLEAAARTLAMEVFPIEAATLEQLDSGFAQMVQHRADGLIVLADTFLVAKSAQIAALSLNYRLPSVMQQRAYAESGGLASYGADSAENHKRAATYVDKILKGAKPADLPVEQPTRLQLLINLRTAKALGLTIPQPVLLRADRVIE